MWQRSFCCCRSKCKKQPTYCETCYIGVLDLSPIHFREIFKGAILSNSDSIIVAHNHISGNLKPSNEDIKVTKTLIEAGDLLDIKVLDHIIVSNSNFLSLEVFYGRYQSNH